MPGVNDTFGSKLAAPLTNPTSAAVFLTQDSVTSNAQSSSTPTKAAVVYLPEVQVDNYNIGTGTKFPLGTKRFVIRIAGRVSAGASTTATFQLQLGNSTNPGSNTTIPTASALTTGAFNLLGNFQFSFTLVYDATAKLLSGSASGTGGTTNVIVSPGAITPITFDPSLGKQPLCLTASVASGNASTVVYLDEFAAEVN